MSWKTVALESDLYTFDYFLADYVCRICWCQDGVKEITATMSENIDTNVTIAEIIYECIGVDLSINTRPTKICSSCWNEVENFSEFKNFCHTTQEKLYDILQKGSHKTELDRIDDKSDKSFDYTSDANFSNLELDSMNTIFEDLNKESIELTRKKPNKRKQKSDTYCSQCKTDLGSLDNLTQHNIEIHSLHNGMYKCFGCDRVFKQRKRCIRHETEYCKALKDGYKCDVCGKFSQKRSHFENHLRAHRENVDLPEDTFKCKKCVKEFISMELLTEHMTIHEKEKKNWVCDTCGRVFVRRDYLYKHKLMHAGLKQHACPHCDFRTIQKSSLNVHIRKHTGERPYPCSLCPQRCVNSSNLREHMKRHLGIKHFQCNLCDKKFGYKISLQEHISSIHERSEVHSCAECGATYSRYRGLRRHLAAKHGKLQPKDKQFGKEDEVLMVKNTDGVGFLCNEINS